MKKLVGKKEVEFFICNLFFLLPVFFMTYISSFVLLIFVGDIILFCFYILQKSLHVGLSRANAVFGLLTFWIILNSIFYNGPYNLSILYALLFIEWLLLANFEYKGNAQIKMIEYLGLFHIICTILVQILPVNITNLILKRILVNYYWVSYNWRVVQGYNCGITTQPGENAMYIILFLAVMFAKAYCTKNKRYFFGSFVAYLCLFTTGKRGTLIFSLLVVIFILLKLGNYKFTRKQWIYMFAGILVVILAGVFVVKETSILNAVYRKMEALNNLSDISAGRFELWKQAYDTFELNPLVGAGIKSIFSDVGMDVHNIYLQFLAELGIIGFMLLIIFIFIMVRICIKKLNMLRTEQNIEQNKGEKILVGVFLILFLIIYGLAGNPFIDYIPLEVFVLSASMLYNN